MEAIMGRFGNTAGLLLAVLLFAAKASAIQLPDQSSSTFIHQYGWLSPELTDLTPEWVSLLQDWGFLSADIETPSEEEINAATKKVLALRAELRSERNGPSPGEILSRAIKQHRLPELVNELTPEYAGFSRLRKAISAEMRRQTVPLPEFGLLTGLSLGQSHPEVAVFRTYLANILDHALPPGMQERTVWDPSLVLLLKDYQRQHNLDVSGHLDEHTLRHLKFRGNPLPAMRYSLRQWLQLPKRMPDRTVLVNIPHFELLFIEAGRVELVMPVIVGKPDSPTPRLNSRFGSVTFNPSWTPPVSILKTELLPLLQKDPFALKKRGFELFPRDASNVTSPLGWEDFWQHEDTRILGRYVLRQIPGNNNPLGRVRFNLQQTQAIYLHDTPQKQLFGESRRALSHGCVRVADAGSLVDAIFKKPGRYRGLSFQKRPDWHEALESDVSVHFVYMPVWVDTSGSVLVANDIYGKAS
ncbi:L,D-transpeptidase family protein [Marinobacter salinisoli]|uniref:L,D-transpeptidase family protein n=1 Tax=Marinobacter salinisoli TaxID=2769486 RepID=A0ABX7MRR3_9GAMM|nr:L,D-transpeptidase family protein [Marinobacter salinisoli]QSP94974.1 L,D-transpeptidase family protein [Marinobacter salinisoli]